MSFRKAGWLAALAAVTVSLAAIAPAQAQQKQTLLNVSYDPTRELYRAIDDAFAKQYKDKAGVELTIRQSHGGSGRQARSVIDGLEADVVTLALAYDIDAIADRGLLPENWQARLPQNSSPYTSTIVFLVRKGNPKQIKDWDDLVKDGVQVITPNPKTSGGARWNYLAAWAYALEKNGGSEDKAKAYVGELLKHVPVLDTGARGATTTFVERGVGDVLLAWENEAFLALEELGRTSSTSWCPRCPSWPSRRWPWSTRSSTRRAPAPRQAYLEFLYTPAAQEIIAKNYYRPIDKDVAAKYESKFPKVKLVKIDDKIFGGWRKAQKDHFSDGGTFDQIYQPQKK